MMDLDGKMRLRDAMATEEIFRLIESIPSSRAELFKVWLSKLGRSVISNENSLGYKYIDDENKIEKNKGLN